MFCRTSDSTWQRLLRAVLLLVVCGLCGTFDILNSNLTRWATRLASFPEEEEFHAKDRASLVAACQPSRRGAIRPNTPPSVGVRARPFNCTSKGCQRRVPRAIHDLLTGAGIFQHC